MKVEFASAHTNSLLGLALGLVLCNLVFESWRVIQTWRVLRYQERSCGGLRAYAEEREEKAS
jgi:hypothetical protein